LLLPRRGRPTKSLFQGICVDRLRRFSSFFPFANGLFFPKLLWVPSPDVLYWNFPKQHGFRRCGRFFSASPTGFLLGPPFHQTRSRTHTVFFRSPIAVASLLSSSPVGNQCPLFFRGPSPAVPPNVRTALFFPEPDRISGWTLNQTSWVAGLRLILVRRASPFLLFCIFL